MMNKAILRFNLYQILKMPSIFFKHPFFLKINRKMFSKNKISSYCIAIILNIDQSKVKNFYCSSGTVKVFTEHYVYKIGMKNGSLKQEYINAKIIHENFLEIAAYLPVVEYSKKFLFHIMKMKRYHQFKEERVYADQVLKTFAKYAIKRKCYVAEFPHIMQGLKLAKILYPSIDLGNKVEEAFSVLWEIGPVHGDFHRGNILINDNDFPFIIDLDNFNLKGIQALDAFTFWIDDKIKDATITWQDVIRSIMKTETKEMKSVAFLYILNRLGYENIYYGFLSRSVEKEFRLIEELVSENKEVKKWN